MEYLSASGIALAVVATLMLGVWILSLIRRDASIVDIFWGLAFVLVAWTYHLVAGSGSPRETLLLALVSLWGLRLSVYIFWRNHGKPEDYRYREMREARGSRFPLWSLFGIFGLQGGLVWILSIPFLFAIAIPAPGGLGWLEGAGLAVFAIGFAFEAIGDLQLASFRAERANRGKVLGTGLWRYTRHPNYFGDALVWWGFFLVAAAAPGAAWTVYSPILMTVLLMRVSGVTLLEKKLDETRPGYREYKERTNAFVPWFPRSPRSDGRAGGAGSLGLGRPRSSGSRP